MPLLLLLGTRVSPQVASFAAALRVAGRAWIAGSSLPIEVAESSWQTIWRISLSGSAGDDLGLYLLLDTNGDGAFEDSEIVLASPTSGSEEHMEVIGAALPAALSAGRVRLPGGWRGSPLAAGAREPASDAVAGRAPCRHRRAPR